MNIWKVHHVVACVLAVGLGCVSPPGAAFDYTFTAGTACDFALGIDVGSGGKIQYREFLDKNGNLIRTLSSGKGFDLLFTNLDTDATFTTRGNGSVQQTRPNGDGVTEVTGGHTVIILFPTDEPAGPSTKVYVGRVVVTIDPAGNYDFQSVSGTSTDICAALSG